MSGATTHRRRPADRPSQPITIPAESPQPAGHPARFYKGASRPKFPTDPEPTTPTKTQRKTNPAKIQQETDPVILPRGPANKPTRHQPQPAIAGAAKHNPSPRRPAAPTHNRPVQSAAPRHPNCQAQPGFKEEIPPQPPNVLEPTTPTKTQRKTNPASNNRNPANTPARPQPQRAIAGTAKHNPSPRNPAAPTHHRPGQAPATRHPSNPAFQNLNQTQAQTLTHPYPAPDSPHQAAYIHPAKLVTQPALTRPTPDARPKPQPAQEPTMPTKTPRETNPALSYSGPANKPGRQQPQRAGTNPHPPNAGRRPKPQPAQEPAMPTKTQPAPIPPPTKTARQTRQAAQSKPSGPPP